MHEFLRGIYRPRQHKITPQYSQKQFLNLYNTHSLRQCSVSLTTCHRGSIPPSRRCSGTSRGIKLGFSCTRPSPISSMSGKRRLLRNKSSQIPIGKVSNKVVVNSMSFDIVEGTRGRRRTY
ncbi:hypothetical protein CDAR_575281 [Caerostris darwini]|uniref:Uncharacterized protein n=1 Tax=Caerostris darwini TaxID=1538125 RepID=A0AAV4MZI9_9ARAC|nr:hypothetical protein CDAR_575281 [Caerostris darwini]